MGFNSGHHFAWIDSGEVESKDEILAAAAVARYAKTHLNPQQTMEILLMLGLENQIPSSHRISAT